MNHITSSFLISIFLRLTCFHIVPYVLIHHYAKGGKYFDPFAYGAPNTYKNWTLKETVSLPNSLTHICPLWTKTHPLNKWSFGEILFWNILHTKLDIFDEIALFQTFGQEWLSDGITSANKLLYTSVYNPPKFNLPIFFPQFDVPDQFKFPLSTPYLLTKATTKCPPFFLF